MMRRLSALAVITLKEGLRSRAVYGIGLFSLFILGLNVSVAGFFMRDVGKVTIDMNLSALSLAGLLLVLFVGLNLIGKDIDRKTIQLVLSKPISRGEYIVGKSLGIALFVFCSLLVLLSASAVTVLSLSIYYENYFGNFAWSTFFVAAFFIYMKVVVLVAITVFFSSITTSSFISLIFSFSVYIVGEVIEEVVFYLRTATATTEVAASGGLKQVIAVVSWVVPNFSLFDYKTEAAYGLALDVERLLVSVGYGLCYVALLLFFAALIFRRREFH